MENKQVDTKATLEWLDDVCSQALTEARQGDTALANRLGQHPALAHYFNNVHTTKSIRPDTWTQMYNPYLREADRLRQLAEAESQHVETQERVNTLEAKLDKLTSMVESFIESQETQEPVEEEPAKKPRKSSKKPVDVETEADETPEDSEGESED
jgi:hypothetical protein